MAEAAAIASVVGIASFGIQLTKVLYDFGSNVSTAREQTSYIARHVDLYANVLDILTERIDDEEPILSDAAFDLIDELKYQSNELFSKIEQSLPVPKDGKDEISFLQKVKWNFTSTKVAHLVGELDYLRSTVHLLVTIIFTGRKIRSRRKRKVKSNTSEDSSKVDNDLRKQGTKAQNALLAHHDALEKLSDLGNSVESQESDGSAKVSPQRPSTRTDIICSHTTAFAELQQSLMPYTDPTERQRIVLQRSVHVLQQLFQQWTTVDLSPPAATTNVSEAESQERQDSSLGTGKIDLSQYPKDPVESTIRGGRDAQIRVDDPKSTSSSHSKASPGPQELHHDAPFESRSSRYAKTTGLNDIDDLKNSLPFESSASNVENADFPKHIDELTSTLPFKSEGAARKTMTSTSKDSKFKAGADIAQRDSGYGSTSDPSLTSRNRTPVSNADLKSAKFSADDWSSATKVASWDADKTAKATQDAPDRLPSGWTKHLDNKTGATFYHNAERRQSQWTAPTEGSNIPSYERTSTPYSSSTRERTVLGGRSQAQASKVDANPGISAEDLFAQFFDPGGGFGGMFSTSKTTEKKSTRACHACSGLGGRADKIRECVGCRGRGKKTMMRQMGPTIQKYETVCPDCNGAGDIIPERYLCKVCRGSKKEPRDLDDYREEYREPRSEPRYYPNRNRPRSPQPDPQTKADAGEEAERVQCASQ